MSKHLMTERSGGAVSARIVSKRQTAQEDLGSGLRFAGKTLSIKTVARATYPFDVLPVCLAHNLRQRNEGHRQRSPIDRTKSHLNEVIHGTSDLAMAIELTANAFAEFSIEPARCDAIMGIELVFQPPAGADSSEFWAECLSWVRGRYGYILSAVVHRDQKRVHMHVLVMAIEGDKLAGNKLTAGSNRFVHQRQAFFAHMRSRLNLRPDRRVKSLAELAVSTGRGPKTKPQADRSDSALLRRHTHKQLIELPASGIDVDGGSSPTHEDPHTQAVPRTPLLRSASGPAELFAAWRQHWLAKFNQSAARDLAARDIKSARRFA